MSSLAHMRLWGLIRKESLQILRDPSSIAIAFVMPVVLLFLFGYGVSLDAKHIPVGIVIEQPDRETQSLAGAFERSEFFSPQYFSVIQTAQKALDEHQIDGIVWLRSNFSAQLLSNTESPIGVIVNGVDSNQANITQRYITGTWQGWLSHYAESRGQSLQMPVSVEQRVWFNTALSSRLFLVPGLIAIVMTLIGSLLTAMVVAREWERGTMEAMMVTPLRRGEILAGKLIPYFVLGMGGMLFSVALAVWQFNVPLHGSFWLLMVSSALFMLVALAIGLLISIVAKNQFVAGLLAIIVTFLPAFILSGFLFDIHSMPSWIQFITYLVPARYFVAILQTLFLAGDVWSVVLPNIAALLIMSLFYFSLVWRKFHKRLE
ncbi:ABC transporter permease [Amphritea sp. 2_MG-2023]|uniref:ABC transporter permease n=1 Tax=Amphritea TaxID=515417 RepID=UPI001C0760A5|nr:MULTISPECIES: ABC transporter permease [Amphritea]MBU2964144.1 ABC transporter permease [Amphritea atlantica]MDO6418543.1 ABC transporter permease [Amphritea sp. 2_MG-2023]MDX2422903.1 ABC transporter permease [Amphritea sp.]